MADATPTDPALPPSPRRRRRKLAPRVRAWTREHLDSERVVDFLKQLLWVGPLTVLIWIYAERQQQFVQPGVAVPVELVSGDPTKAVRLLQPADGNVMLTVRGPKGAIDKLTERMRSPGGNAPVQIRVDKTGRGGEQDLTIRGDSVGDDPRFRDAGIRIDGAQPETMVVRVEDIVERDVVVTQRPGDSPWTATFEPAVVKVRGPASVVGNPATEPDPRVAVYGEIAGRVDPTVSTDQDVVLRDVKLTVNNENRNVTLGVQTVTATLRPVAADTLTFDAVPVQVLWNADRSKSYDLSSVTPPTLPRVVVAGPKKEIDKLRAPGARIPPAAAVLPDAVQVGDNVATIKFQFGPGVTVKEPADPRVTVTLTAK